VTDAPGNKDAADFGGAIVAKANDTCSMVNALHRLIDSKSLREEYGAAAYEAGKRFSWGKITEQYVNVYNRILGRVAEVVEN
jgi:glycosyltransferase involved in cell wall biosynthesis